MPAAKAALEAARLDYELLTFTEADHAFFNDTGARFKVPAAEEAWRRVDRLVRRRRPRPRPPPGSEPTKPLGDAADARVRGDRPGADGAVGRDQRAGVSQARRVGQRVQARGAAARACSRARP